MTFSLVGRCERSGAVGAVIASASMAVAARCAAVRAGAGAVCSQSTTDPRLREALLEQQKQFLPAMLKSDVPLDLTRPGETKRWHILLRDYEAAAVWGDILAFARDPSAPLPSGVGVIPAKPAANATPK